MEDGLPKAYSRAYLLETARNLNVDASTVSRVVARFDSTGSVDTKPRKGSPKTLTRYDEFLIIDAVLEKPSSFLYEIQRHLRVQIYLNQQ